MNDLWKLGMGLIWMEMLIEAGYHCLDDLAAATDEELLALPGLGPSRLQAIRKAAPHVEQLAYVQEELGDDLQAIPCEEESGTEH